MRRRFGLVMVATGWLAGSCASAQTADDPDTITRAEFKQLRWIEGSWRGSGVGQSPFFERYSFPNDTTLAVEHFADSTFARVTETSYYVLAHGTLASTNPQRRWQAKTITARDALFGPMVGVTNSFLWRLESADAWTAVILLPETPTKPRRERIYNMVRARR
jgi:hypothetical protein